jgi:hypothetical protein
MKSECHSCKKTFSGSGLTVNVSGNEHTYCANCYWKLQAEYEKKKSCEDCGYFDEESCEKNKKNLVPAKVGFNSYFVEAENCREFSTEKKGNPKKKEKELSQTQKETAALIKNLSEKGKTLTYYCCHCGAPIKIGAKAPETQDTCVRCKGDLEVINLAKLIKQH